MAITNFIPELWVANMLDRWENEKVFASLVDRSYEGIASKGNTVHIPAVVRPTIKDYKANSRTTTADAISDTGVDLLIDQEKNWDIYIDDIDRAQAAGQMSPYTDAAADALIEDADLFIAEMLVDGGTALSGTAPTTGDAAFNLVRDARKTLNVNKAPSAGRVLVGNAAFESLLLGADSKLTAVDTSGDNNGLRMATIGTLLGFRVITSNNLPENTDPAFVAFHPSAAAYVSQIDEVEALRADNKFADRFRGLHVYGGKVVRPEGVAVFGAAAGS
ncbi:P22 phage major capsid protein family protein [Gordonia tangerina]|uniref:Major capsid protein n=1 Tax=Gordonia tangerina TaxID=2911060 RepID=A0ABS9DTQ4_9ACTN|nr:P22 phage major capsid protein family protein [Gordonia tangerina]MCF3941326.1 hypothetical protein [Gordonia tangerina]